MSKTLLLGLMLFLFSLVSFPSAHAQEVKVVLEDFLCLEEKYVIRFGVANSYTLQKDSTIAFKILQGRVPVACTEITLSVPGDSDGSVLREIALDGPCATGELTLESRIFDQSIRNRVGPWLSDCPK
jgi:hypothetical protein